MAKAKRAELPELLADFSPDIVELSHDSFPSYELRSYQIPPARAIPIDRFIFSQQSKSQLGWDFIGLIETGRYKEYVDPAPVGSAARSVTEAFWAELRAIEFAVREGPGRSIRWGTPAGRGHDDLVMSAALVARLEGVEWGRRIAVGVGRRES